MGELRKISREDLDVFINKPLRDDVHYQANVGKSRRGFVKIFEDFIDELPNLSGVEVKVFLWLSMRMDFKKASYLMNDDFWDCLERDLGICREYGRRILTSLKRKSFIYDDKFTLYVGSRYASKKKL